MKSNWARALILVGIGAFLGAGVSCWVIREGPGFGGGSRHYGSMRDRFIKKLDLTPDQQTQVNAILKKRREQIDQLLSPNREKMKEIKSSAREEIRKVLNPEQQAKFDRWESRRQERIKKWQGKEGWGH